MVRAGRLGDVRPLDEEADALRDALTGLPGHHLMRHNFALVAAVAEAQVAAVGADRGRLWAAVRTARQALDEGAPAGVAPPAVASLAGALDVLGAALDGDPATVTAAIQRMEAELGDDADARDDDVAVADQRVARQALLGQAYLAALEVGAVTGAVGAALARVGADARRPRARRGVRSAPAPHPRAPPTTPRVCWAGEAVARSAVIRTPRGNNRSNTSAADGRARGRSA